MPVWTLFSLAILGRATTAEIADLSGVQPISARRHLAAHPTLADATGISKNRVWRSVLTPEQVGELHLHLSADQVERRRRKILEDRLEFHENKFRYLTSNGLHTRAAVHFRYAEKYRAHLEAA